LETRFRSHPDQRHHVEEYEADGEPGLLEHLIANAEHTVRLFRLREVRGDQTAPDKYPEAAVGCREWPKLTHLAIDGLPTLGRIVERDHRTAGSCKHPTQFPHGRLPLGCFDQLAERVERDHHKSELLRRKRQARHVPGHGPDRRRRVVNAGDQPPEHAGCEIQRDDGLAARAPQGDCSPASPRSQFEDRTCGFGGPTRPEGVVAGVGDV
jgi:hypothetical protein